MQPLLASPNVGRRNAFIGILLLLTLSIVLLIVPFFKPWFVRTPYEHYNVNYYFDYAKYNINSKKFDFDDCDTQSKTDIYSPMWCHLLLNTGRNSIILNIISLAFLFSAMCIIGLKLCFSQFDIRNTFLYSILFLFLISYGLLTTSFVLFVASWPYTKYCAYGNGFSTGCDWGESVFLTLGATLVLVVAICVVIALIYPICSICCPCCEPKKERELLVDDANTLDDNSEGVEEEQKKKNQRGKKRNYFFNLTRMQLLTMELLALILGMGHELLAFYFVYLWHDAYYGAQSYTDKQWNSATCDNDGGSYKPFKSDTEVNCSFSYPDVTTYNNTYWSCCSHETCSLAFNYTTLITGYGSEYVNCTIDMEALTKASCHPLRSQFVGSNFNITKSPLTKNNVTFSNSVAVCYLFCQQTYGHCKDSYFSNSDMTVGQRFPSADEFCTEELGVILRYEVFTDRCFAGCSMLNVNYAFVAILLVWIIM